VIWEEEGNPAHDSVFHKESIRASTPEYLHQWNLWPDCTSIWYLTTLISKATWVPFGRAKLQVMTQCIPILMIK
jgi:hypothetical protein